MNKLLLWFYFLSFIPNISFAMDKGKRPLDKGKAAALKYVMYPESSYNPENSFGRLPTRSILGHGTTSLSQQNPDEAGPSTSESADITDNAVEMIDMPPVDEGWVTGQNYSTALKEARYLHFRSLYGSGTSFSYPDFGPELSPAELASHRESYKTAYVMAFGEPNSDSDSNDSACPENAALMLSGSTARQRGRNAETPRRWSRSRKCVVVTCSVLTGTALTLALVLLHKSTDDGSGSPAPTFLNITGATF